MEEAQIQHAIERALPGSVVSVSDYTGGGDHFRVEVVSDAFAGRSRVEQHKLVYAAVRSQIADGSIHALSLQTRTPGD